MDVKAKILREFSNISENTARVVSEMANDIVGYGNLVNGGKKPFSKKSVTCLCIGAQERFNCSWVVFRLKNEEKIIVMSGEEWKKEFSPEEYKSPIHI